MFFFMQGQPGRAMKVRCNWRSSTHLNKEANDPTAIQIDNFQVDGIY